MKKILLLLPFIFLAAFTSKRNKPSKFDWTYSAAENGKSVKFYKMKIGKKQLGRSNELPQSSTYRSKAPIAGSFFPKLNPPVLVYTKSQQKILISFWATGQVGLIKVFNPLKQTQPVCTVESESDHIDYRFRKGRLQLKVEQNNRFRWKTCQKI